MALKPFTMSGRLLRVPSFPRGRGAGICAGCALRDEQSTHPPDSHKGPCDEKRCREPRGDHPERFNDFILISPEMLEKYKVAYATFCLDGVVEEQDTPGDPWHFYQPPKESINE